MIVTWTKCLLIIQNTKAYTQALVTGDGKVPFPVTYAYNLHIFLSVCSFTKEGREEEFGKKQLQSVL